MKNKKIRNLFIIHFLNQQNQKINKKNARPIVTKLINGEFPWEPKILLGIFFWINSLYYVV